MRIELREPESIMVGLHDLVNNHLAQSLSWDSNMAIIMKGCGTEFKD